MQTEKTYTPKQLATVDRMLDFLAKLPKDRRSMVVMAANAFIAGMEAQTQLASQTERPSA